MGVPVEFNAVLALRDAAESINEQRHVDEYLPDHPKVGQEYGFRKCGQRIYQLGVPLSLLTTAGDNKTMQKVGTAVIIEARHIMEEDHVLTIGRYRILKLNDA